MNSPEFVHEYVEQFVYDWIYRKIRFRDVGELKEPRKVAERYANVLELLYKLLDQNIVGSERAKIENEVFGKITALNSVELIIRTSEGANYSHDDKIEKLEAKLQSNNKLLTSVLKILQDVSIKLDNMDKK